MRLNRQQLSAVSVQGHFEAGQPVGLVTVCCDDGSCMEIVYDEGGAAKIGRDPHKGGSQLVKVRWPEINAAWVRDTPLTVPLLSVSLSSSLFWSVLRLHLPVSLARFPSLPRGAEPRCPVAGGLVRRGPARRQGCVPQGQSHRHSHRLLRHHRGGVSPPARQRCRQGLRAPGLGALSRAAGGQAYLA